jgi:hypothetical protein
MTLPPKGLIKALVCFCGINGVKKGSQGMKTFCSRSMRHLNARVPHTLAHYPLHTLHKTQDENVQFQLQRSVLFVLGWSERRTNNRKNEETEGGLFSKRHEAKQRRSVRRRQAASKTAPKMDAQHTFHDIQHWTGGI